MATITIQVPDDRCRKLGELAESLGITPERLVQANVEDIRAQSREDFRQALSYVLEKNEELYRRLAAQGQSAGSAR
jgi:predicted transcriptional regulator